MRRWSGVLIVLSILLPGCVDTAEPTGPVPTPPGDEGGELTSAVTTEAGVAEDVAGAQAPRRSRASR
jgi:hypothetical protein